MEKPPFNDLLRFVTVAREGSFTRAAARLGLSQSALSQSIAALEARLQVRLLTRTTRSVAPTQAGQRLARSVGEHLDAMQGELERLRFLSGQPAGTVRITCAPMPLRTLLLPRLIPLLKQYPDIHMEFDGSPHLRDLAAEGFDAGVRLGESIEQDMIAVPVGPPLRMAAVATPEYFARHGQPQTPHDLAQHRCINWRMPTSGALYAWEFEQAGKALNVRVPGQLVLAFPEEVVQCALAGLGLAFSAEDDFEPWLSRGELVRVLQDWCPPFAGYSLYWPSRRQMSPAFSLVVQALRQGMHHPPDFPSNS